MHWHRLLPLAFVLLLSLCLIAENNKRLTSVGKFLLGLDGGGADNQNTNKEVDVGGSFKASAAASETSNSAFDWLHDAVQETTRLLYQDSPNLTFWLEQPLPKIYIYPTLPHEWSDPTNISDCIHQNFLFDKRTNESWPNCRWYPNRICSDEVAPKSFFEIKYMTYRQNYNMDIQYLEWFRNYPLRTEDPQEADLFVVPYPHWSHCLCRKDFKKRAPSCSYNVATMNQAVLTSLNLWNISDMLSMQRHLWLWGIDWGLLKPNFQRTGHFSLHLGTSPCVLGSSSEKPCGHLVVPFVSTEPWFQPDAHGKQDWWDNMRDRRYAMGAILGTPKSLVMRVEFTKTYQDLLGDTVGGKPLRIIDLGTTRAPMKSIDFSMVYRESILCPVLPGDGPPQKRIYDVMMMGCIPIMPVWDSYDSVNGTTYPSLFAHRRESARMTYAYHRSSFSGDGDAGLDYVRDLVVTFNGTCGLACLKGAAEAVLSNVEELDRLQGNLRKYSRLFSYGLEDRAYRYADGFTATLVSMRHYLYRLKEPE